MLDKGETGPAERVVDVGVQNAGSIIVGTGGIGAVSMPVVGMFLPMFGIVGFGVAANGRTVLTTGAATGGVDDAFPMLASDSVF